MLRFGNLYNPIRRHIFQGDLSSLWPADLDGCTPGRRLEHNPSPNRIPIRLSAYHANSEPGAAARRIQENRQPPVERRHHQVEKAIVIQVGDGGAPW